MSIKIFLHLLNIFVMTKLIQFLCLCHNAIFHFFLIIC